LDEHASDRLDKIRDEIDAALILSFHLRPLRIDRGARLHQAIIRERRPRGGRQQDGRGQGGGAGGRRHASRGSPWSRRGEPPAARTSAPTASTPRIKPSPYRPRPSSGALSSAKLAAAASPVPQSP